MDDEEFTDSEVDELMDWAASVYEVDQPTTVDLTEIEVVLTSQGAVYLTDSNGRADV